MADRGLPHEAHLSMQWGAASETAASFLQIDSLGNVTHVCGSRSDALGCPVSDAIGRPILEVLDPGFADAVKRVCARLEERPGQGHSEIGTARKGDVLIGMWEVSAYSLDDGGAIVLVRDLKDLAAFRRNEQAYVKRLRNLALASEDVAQEERRVLAVELHDRVSQPLAAARLRLQEHDRLHRGLEIVPREAQHKEMLALLDAAIAESRAVTSDLAPVVYYELGLPPALYALGDDIERRYGIRCTVLCDVAEGVSPREGITAFVYRAARELLYNVHKHAETTEAKVHLLVDGEDVRLTVCDHGVGFDVADALYSDRHTDMGFGLFSIREHAERLGGDLTMTSAPGEGTCAVLTIPMEK
ncbi:MAG: hypothetical protein JW733_02195 [Coriobacteriia bacterium]|nr:hypothetical protein [Coriobacteriia bacterium]MBN2840492.1 hypothetical protein [Coriobacteriia bacterium]